MRASMLIELEKGNALQAFAGQAQFTGFLALPGYGCPSMMWYYVTAMHLYHSWVQQFVSKGSSEQAMTLHSLGICLPFMMHRRLPTNLYLKWSYSNESKALELSKAMQCYKAHLGEVTGKLLGTKCDL